MYNTRAEDSGGGTWLFGFSNRQTNARTPRRQGSREERRYFRETERRADVERVRVRVSMIRRVNNNNFDDGDNIIISNDNDDNK